MGEGVIIMWTHFDFEKGYTSSSRQKNIVRIRQYGKGDGGIVGDQPVQSRTTLLLPAKTVTMQ
jgi:hypothetical protein